MKYRRLGKTDIRVSVIGVGTWQFGGEWGKTFEQSEVNAMLAKAAELGINLIDTAECYGDHLSEKLIGRAIEGQRDKWIIATKFGHGFKPNFGRDFFFEPEHVQKQLELSLKSLKTDYIDLYQFHSGTDEMFDIHGLWEMLQKQVKAGKVRHLGISISSKQDRIYQVNKSSEVGAEAIQVVYNRIERKPEEKVFDSCISKELGVLARVPLASGFLSGKYNKDAKFDGSDVRSSWQDDEMADVIKEVAKIKKEIPQGVPMAQWALAWCLRHPAVTCVIPGCKNVEQVESNAMAADLQDVSDDHPQAVQTL
jgi:aryl-alcohol dehydrogenase-like predicted oxidoreductase